jgi:hypothetical protein
VFLFGEPCSTAVEVEVEVEALEQTEQLAGKKQGRIGFLVLVMRACTNADRDRASWVSVSE